MRKKGAALFSVGMGLAGVFMMGTYMAGRENRLLELAAPTNVVVAAADIPANTMIDERMIQRIQVPAKYRQPTGLANIDDARGRVAAISVPKGAQVISTYLQDASRTALAYQVPSGSRAVTIAVSDVTGVGGLVRPANFVDIVGTFEFGRPSGGGPGRGSYTDERTETRTLLQNVLVVAVGRDYIGERAETRLLESGRPSDQGSQPPSIATTERNRDVKNVTVLVTPDQVQQLILAQQIGTLSLSLRSNLDAGQKVDLTALDPNALLHAPVPLKFKEMPAWREIRGTTPY